MMGSIQSKELENFSNKELTEELQRRLPGSTIVLVVNEQERAAIDELRKSVQDQVDSSLEQVDKMIARRLARRLPPTDHN